MLLAARARTTSQHPNVSSRTSPQDSFLDEGFILDKRIGVGQPHRVEKAQVLIANTPMDTDKIKIYGARVKVDSMAKVLGLAVQRAAERGRSGTCPRPQGLRFEAR